MFEGIRKSVILYNKCCCDFMNDACINCVKAFCEHFERGELIFDNQIMSFYKSEKDNYVALCLFSFRGELMWGNCNFAGKGLIEFFHKHNINQKYKYENYCEGTPYQSHLSLNEDDKSLNVQDSHEFKQKVVIYYLLSRALTTSRSSSYLYNVINIKKYISPIFETKSSKINIITLGKSVKEL